MTKKARTQPDLAEMERQDAEAYARQPQDPEDGAIQDWDETDVELADAATAADETPDAFQLWIARADALAAAIMARRKGKPLDLDAILRADRADLEARDDAIIRGLSHDHP